MRWSRAVDVWLVVVLSVGLVSACSGDDAPEESVPEESVPETPRPVTSFSEQLYWAESEGFASEKQLEALRAAEAAGEMSYAELEELLQDSFACIEDSSAGGYVRLSDLERAPGVYEPNYALRPPVEAADACVREHSLYAEFAYQNQPIMAEAWDRAIEEARPQILACLREGGVQIDDDATTDELFQASEDLFTRLFILDAENEDPDFVSLSCTEQILGAGP